MTRIGLLVLGLAFSACAFSQDSSGDIRRIEQAFVSAQNLVVINRKADLPPDVAARIPNWDRLAEFGATWNSGDRITLDDKVGQFVFAGISETFAAVVTRQGGSRTVLVLAERHKPGVCHFYLGSSIPDVLDQLRGAIEQGGIAVDGIRVNCWYVASG